MSTRRKNRARKIKDAQAREDRAHTQDQRVRNYQASQRAELRKRMRTIPFLMDRLPLVSRDTGDLEMDCA